MSSPILPFYKTPHVSIKTNIESVGALPSLQATIACVGHRTQIPGYNVTSSELNPLVPTAGYPQLQYFFPFTLPTFSSGYEALSYMQSLGFTVNFGLSGTLIFPAPTSVSSLVAGVQTLTFSTMPANYMLLLNASVSATISQTQSGPTTVTGVVQSVSAVPNVYTITLSSVSGAFVTTALDTLSVSYINNSLGLPDPNRTEEICMQVFYMYQAMNLIQGGIQYNFTKPSIFISVLSDRETSGSFAPNATPLVLGVPSAVAASGSNFLIGYATAPATSGYVPLQPLGNTQITQTLTTSTATLIGILPAQVVNSVFCNFVIEVNSASSFIVSDSCSLVLDSTQNVFVLMDALSFTVIVNPYNVATNTDISTNQVVFFNYIASTNQPTEVEKGHYGVFGCSANTTIPAQQMSTLPTGVNGLVAPGNWFSPVYYPYTPNVGEYPQSSAVIAAAYAAFYSCNTAPYNPQSLLTIPGILSSANTMNRVVYGLTGATSCEIALDLGWSPLCVNASGDVFCPRLITGQVTLPQTNVIDVEFFPISTWQIVQLFQQQIYVSLIAAGVKQLRQTPLVIAKVKGSVVAVMSVFQTLGMFENVHYWAKQVTVTQSNIPDTIYIAVPAQVIPELASAFVQVGLISSLIQTGQ